MPRRARLKGNSGIYHVISRGANKQEIFHDDEDCMQFLDIVEKYKKKANVSIYAWCLMNNHVHLLLKEGTEELSITMKRIGVSYVSYYNWKYQTTGHLFQDRFTSENVESNRRLFTVIRYIHQNPVKAGMVRRVNEWKWSSCRGYYGENSYLKKLVDAEFILKKISPESAKAIYLFKEFNERSHQDQCLDVHLPRRRLLDGEASQEIKKLLGVNEIAQVKSLPRLERDEVLRKVKEIDGLSQRQAARILGISASLIFRA
ncbi:REP-associated tyrosine transposase [Neobacillus sp. D3-1R]|uniref:REP-associated tyrosine transposase n=1 Tax=Neobacillus sp. D3-1R TaxID=3445778 RepID=UPI003FA0F50D